MPCMSDDATFLKIEAAAHGGAFGNNPLPTPSDAQCLAGNYKLGRTSIYGLPIAIEQPRGSYRTGVDANGKRWATRMAAHYGYISGTKGNDGDCVDCFIGFYPQSDVVFVINQNIGGKFDEHKVCLCYPDAETARRGYMDSYERGWQGLESLVPLSISQLKWWLKRGDMSRPLRAANLPHEGFETMTRKVQWGGDALPHNQTLDQVLYEVRRADAGEGLLLDSVSATDILDDSEGALAFDALVSPYAKLERKMTLLQGVMDRTGGSVKTVALQITEPFKQRGVANVAAIFELSDGQTVSIYFHNPDVTPNKMAATDEVISWKWLLNKKDITIVVAPERGEDLNIREVARRIMKLAEKNSAAFQRANSRRTETMARLNSLKNEISGLETELAAAQHDLEVAKVEAEDRKIKRGNLIASEFNGRWRVTSAKNMNPISPSYPTKEEAEATIDVYIRTGNFPESSDLVKKLGGDSTSPEVAQKSDEQVESSDVFAIGSVKFQAFAVKIRQGKQRVWGIRVLENSKEMNPADGNGSGFKSDTKASMIEDMERSYAAITKIGDKAKNENRWREGFGLAPLPAEESSASSEQALIDAYIKAWGEEAAMVNAAVGAVNWSGISDNASATAEIQKLQSAANSERPIIKARDALEAAGMKTWDDRLAGVTDSPEFKAQGEAMGGYRAAMDKIQAIAKEKLIEAGKAELAALPDDAPLADMARAVFRKNGIDIGQQGENWVARVAQEIEAKNADGLRDILAGVGSDSNKASMEIFERAAGFKLAKTQKERAKQIDEWAGITTERRAEIEAAKDAAWQGRKLEEGVKDAWGWLKSMNVRDGADALDGQQYLLRQFADGYDEVDTGKKGVATIYGMKKGNGLRYVNNRSFNGFLKAAMAFGGLRQALDLVGAKIAEPMIEVTGTELGDFSDSEDGKKGLRSAAKSAFGAMLGQMVPCQALGGDVELRKSGMKKALSLSADARKLKLIPALVQLIGIGKKLSTKPPYLASEINVVAYHTMRSLARLEGIGVAVRFVIKEDDKGMFHWDHTVHAPDVVLDSAQENGPDCSDPHLASNYESGGRAVPARLAGGRPYSPTRGGNESTVGSLGDQDGYFNGSELAIFDENEIGKTFDPEEFALDSAAGGAMVFNLFIEGEIPEEVEGDELSESEASQGAAMGIQLRSGTAEEQAAADVALVMVSGEITKLGGAFSADGHSGEGTVGAWSYGNATVNGKTIRLAASGGGVVQINGKPHGPDGALNLSAEQVSAAILAVAPAVVSNGDDQAAVDRALFQSVIEGTVPDILAPSLADSLEAAYYRQQTDPALVSLFEQAVNAYQAAMMAATAELA